MDKKNDKLLKKYDEKIRQSCNYKKNMADECLLHNNGDEVVCSIYLNDFLACVKNFDVEFKKKHFYQKK